MSDQYREETLYQHMPVYHARLSAVRDRLSQDTDIELDAFHMHYDGVAPLERAKAFFDDTGALLDLGCGYGSNVIWFAGHTPGYRSYLGVDLMKEHIEIAEVLASRLRGEDKRIHFLAYDIAELNPALYSAHAGGEQATAVLSLNTFLHLTAEQRRQCWQLIDQILVPGGKVYVEDFIQRGGQDREAFERMAEESGAAYLPGRAEYVDLIAKVLPGAGVEDEDISDIYARFSKQRHESYQGDDPSKRRFYKTVSDCINSGAVGGIRIRVTKS